MAFNITIDVKGADGSLLNLFDDNTMQGIYAGIGEHLISSIDDQFNTQGNYWGDGWDPLSPSYLAYLTGQGRYENESGDTEMMIRGGEGSEALSQSFSYVATANGLEIGSSASYAPYQHFGAEFTHPGNYYVMTDDGPRFISETKKRELEAKGGTVKHTGSYDIKIPARPLLPNSFEDLTEEDIEEIIGVVRIKLEAKLR